MSNAPKVVVARSIDALPAKVRDSLNGGFVHGVYWETADGKVTVYVIADQIPNMDALDAAVLHEVVGHYGLRKTLGASFDKVLDMVWNDYGKKIKAADWYERYTKDAINNPNPKNRIYNPNTKKGQRNLAEEYIAKEAEKGNIEPRLWDRIVAAIKNFFRSVTVKRKCRMRKYVRSLRTQGSM